MRRISKLRAELRRYDCTEVNNIFEQISYWPMILAQMDNLFGNEYSQ